MKLLFNKLGHTHWYVVTAILCGGQFDEVEVLPRRSKVGLLSPLGDELLDSGRQKKEDQLSAKTVFNFFISKVSGKAN